MDIRLDPGSSGAMPVRRHRDPLQFRWGTVAICGGILSAQDNAYNNLQPARGPKVAPQLQKPSIRAVAVLEDRVPPTSLSLSPRRRQLPPIDGSPTALSPAHESMIHTKI
jgi:hypothetical protein